MPYRYLRKMSWVNGKPKRIPERYLGSAADSRRRMPARPECTRQLAFRDVASA